MRTRRRLTHLVLVVIALVGRLAFAEVIQEVRVQGNFTIPDDEVLRLAGVAAGSQVEADAAQQIEKRLEETGRFESVSVEKRYRSLTSTDELVLVITVREKEKIKSKFMMMPILSGSDEYGITYGARFSALDLMDAGERISFPLTWGGVRQAAAELEFSRNLPLVTSLFSSAGLSRKENPHFEIGDFRKEIQGGARRRYGPISLDFTGGWTDVDFGTVRDRFVTYGPRFVLDTRQNENLPRNAVYVGLGWNRLALAGAKPDFNRYEADLRGYKGLWGQAILAGQVRYDAADGRLPDYERPFLGGASTLRGHHPGRYIGDNRLITSLELRLPVNSPLAIYRAGFDVFWDSGTVWEHGQSVRDTDFKHGVGAGVFFLIAGFGFKVDVAHDLKGSARVHFSTGFRF